MIDNRNFCNNNKDMRDKAVNLHQQIDATHLRFISAVWIKPLQASLQDRPCLEIRPVNIIQKYQQRNIKQQH